MDEYLCENGHKMVTYRVPADPIGHTEPCGVDGCDSKMKRVK